jgi:hypothetical protein
MGVTTSLLPKKKKKGEKEAGLVSDHGLGDLSQNVAIMSMFNIFSYIFSSFFKREISAHTLVTEFKQFQGKSY